MHQLRFHKQAVKALLRMPEGTAKRMRAELARIAESPESYQGDWKPLTGTPFWRLRVGSWRAICEVRGDELIVYVLKVDQEETFTNERANTFKG